MISVGKKLKTSLPLTVVQAGVVRTAPLSALLQRRTVVSVYMKNNTGSCDKQNDSLVTVAATLAQRGYDLIALSRDTAGSHQKYAAKKGITYALASDPDDLFAQAADSIVTKSMYGRTYEAPARAAFVLERDGTVLAVIEKVDTKDHAAQLLALLDGLGP